MRFIPTVTATGDELRAKVARRLALEDAYYARTHPDYRGGAGEARTVLRYIPGAGTCAVLLASLTDAELEARVKGAANGP